MKRTKILIFIVFMLIFGIFGLLVYDNFEIIKSFVNDAIELSEENNIVIPDYISNNRIFEYKTVSNTLDFVPKNKQDIINIYYTVLNNGWNSFSFYCPKEYINCSEDIREIGDNSEHLSVINNFVSPFNSFVTYNTKIIDNSKIHLEIIRLYSEDDIKESNDLVDAVISKYSIDKDNLTLNNIKFIHNYLIKLMSYDSSYDINSPIDGPNKINGAMAGRKAICSGYTDAFALFMDKLNVPNFKISSEKHVWNVIYFDGKWQHVDVTWDDDEVNQYNNYNFFMIDTQKLFSLDTSEHTFELQNYLELN